jgi:hypothetical protein
MSRVVSTIHGIQYSTHEETVEMIRISFFVQHAELAFLIYLIQWSTMIIIILLHACIIERTTTSYYHRIS